MDINVNSKTALKFLFVLLVLIFACSKKNLVYYTPSNTSKASVNEQIKPLDLVSVQQYDAVVHKQDSPTTPEYNTTPNQRKNYAFDEEESDTKVANKKSKKVNNEGPRKGRYAVLIIGIILLSIGSIWMLSISNSSPSSYESVLNGCFALILSLALTIAGVITTIIGAITAAIN